MSDPSFLELKIQGKIGVTFPLVLHVLGKVASIYAELSMCGDFSKKMNADFSRLRTLTLLDVDFACIQI